ncbi:DUF2163 domain-containing protein [Catenovulum sediminis]|uniref:DUF2163 domain-containing protein n=1 Tax=Catenovulum sediminis TaxID=1740262 RepID=A0ABV1RKT7_9ALTE|nr:DUF2163 domain-containing protein [Catenovulum sediminis]
MKTYPQAVEDMIASGHVKHAYLLYVDFEIPLSFTNAGFDIEADGVTYYSSDILQGVDRLSKQASLTVTEIKLAFSLKNQQMVSIAFSKNWQNRNVQINRVFLGEQNEVIHNENVWKGKTTERSDSDQELLITYTAKNIFGAFETTNSWRTTLASHHRRHPTDDCFKYAHKAQEVQYWGGKGNRINKTESNDSLGVK